MGEINQRNAAPQRQGTSSVIDKSARPRGKVKTVHLATVDVEFSDGLPQVQSWLGIEDGRVTAEVALVVDRHTIRAIIHEGAERVKVGTEVSAVAAPTSSEHVLVLGDRLIKPVAPTLPKADQNMLDGTLSDDKPAELPSHLMGISEDLMIAAAADAARHFLEAGLTEPGVHLQGIRARLGR